jgi:predicted phage terminase large subunit-like protein
MFFPDLSANWHVYEICELLDAFCEAVRQKRSPRLMIFLPPRHTKSQLVSRLLPPFILGHDPNFEVVGASATQDLANDFGRYVRAVLMDPLYRDLFPDLEVDTSAVAADNCKTYPRTRPFARGGYKAIGVGGMLTGFGAHAAIVDDPHKDRESADSESQRTAVHAWYYSVLRTRLAPGGGVIVVQTRWHEDDLAGHLLADAKTGGEKWLTYSFPAIAVENEPWRLSGEALHPDRFDLPSLLALKHTLPPREWNSLYQQNPMPDEGGFFSKKDFTLVSPGSRPKAGNWYISTDLAVSTDADADWSVIWPVCVTADRGLWFAPDVVRGKLKITDAVDAILDLADRYGVSGIVIEKGVIWRAIEPLLKERMRARGRYFQILTPAPGKADKLARARPLQGMMQAGAVAFADTPVIRTDILTEFLFFPGGKHDDSVDCAAWIAYTIDKLFAPAHIPDTDDPDSDNEDIVIRGDRVLTGPDRRGFLARAGAHRAHVPPRLNGRPR